MKIRGNNTLGELGSAIGKGLIAGLAGTAAITLSQLIEMKITKREPSEAPVKVASQTTGIQPASPEQKEKGITGNSLGLWYSMGYCPGIDRFNRIKGYTGYYTSLWGSMGHCHGHVT